MISTIGVHPIAGSTPPSSVLRLPGKGGFADRPSDSSGSVPFRAPMQPMGGSEEARNLPAISHAADTAVQLENYGGGRHWMELRVGEAAARLRACDCRRPVKEKHAC